MTVITKDSLLAALNERDLFNNPDLLERAAVEIDCGGWCEHIRSENSLSGCQNADRDRYCPNDLAETLRALAALARRDGEAT